jgi:hypothetical protein
MKLLRTKLTLIVAAAFAASVFLTAVAQAGVAPP